MLELVSIDDAKDQLRLDGDGHDRWLGRWIPIVSEAVALWLKDDWRLYVAERDASGNVVLDSSGNPSPESDSSGPVVHPVVVGATLVELACAFRFREGEGKDNVVPESAGHGYVLNKASTAMLAPLRKSTVA